MILQHLRTPPVPPHLAKPELAIPEAVSAIVMKALEKDREKRFATGAEMAAAFKKARGSITLHSRKIDWTAVSSASASFGTEIPSSGLSTGATPASRTPTSNTTSQPAPLTGTTIYRTSARIGPPPREFPTRIVLAVAAGVLILGSVFAGRRYFTPSNPVNQVPPPIRAVAPPPLRETKPDIPVKVTPPASATVKPPVDHKRLTFEEQAKVIELNSLADSDYNQGGCEKALPSYQQVLAIDPHDSHAYAAVQMCYAKARGEELKSPATPPDNTPHQ